MRLVFAAHTCQKLNNCLVFLSYRSNKPTLKHSQSDTVPAGIDESVPSRATTPVPLAGSTDAQQQEPSPAPVDATPSSPPGIIPSLPSNPVPSDAHISPSNNVRKPSVLSQLNFPDDKELLPKILTMGMWGALNKNSKELKRFKTAPS